MHVMTINRVSGGGTLATLALAGLVGGWLLSMTGCGAGAGAPERSVDNASGVDTGLGSPGAARDAGAGAGPPRRDAGSFAPEQERDFTFASPVVVGSSLFVANETLDSLAIVDSQSLSIETLLVGTRPTIVDGPDETYSDREDVRVMVLNEGNDSVTVVTPESLETTNHAMPDGVNALEVDPTGRYGVVWYDASKESEQPGDLSSITVVTPETTHRISVGFNVRDVFFDRQGTRALVLTDDGISSIDLMALDGDTIARPTPLVPDALDALQPEDLEVRVTLDARYIVTRSARMRGLVLLDLDKQRHHPVPLPVIPTDLDLLGGDPDQILAMLRGDDRAVRATVPDGLVDLSETLEANGRDLRIADSTSPSDPAADASAMPPDAIMIDGGRDDTSGSTDGGGKDGGQEPPSGFFPSDVQGVETYEIPIPGLGSATFGAEGRRALLFSARGNEADNLETRVVLLNLENGEYSIVGLEKGVRGAISSQQGDTFVIFNTKRPGPLPNNASPNDPEYIARSWAITLLDAESTASQLLLTAEQPGPTTLWAAGDLDPRLYMAFETPDGPSRKAAPSHRDVIEVNLRTFRKRTHRMPSIPTGLGPIRAANRVFVAQRHPEGRMTFLDVATSQRQTITGYELNADIQ